MSGLEAIGVAASIIQVADLGAKLSVKLFSFYQRVKNASDSVQLLSNEIALVSAILRELGDNLKEEEASKLCSKEAFRTLNVVLDQSRDVLGQIQKVIDDNGQRGKGRFQQVAGKLRIAYHESSLDQLKTSLERLKATMLLLLNVITYAGQIRRDGVPTLVREQRDLIQTLLQGQKTDSQIPQASDSTGESEEYFVPPPPQIDPFYSSTDFSPGQRGITPCHQPTRRNRPRSPGVRSSPKAPVNETSQRPQQTAESAEVKEYNLLIRSMLVEIESCKQKLKGDRHSRIKDGILNIHAGEIMRFQIEYGHFIPVDQSLFTHDTSDQLPSPKAREGKLQPGRDETRRPRTSVQSVNRTYSIGDTAMSAHGGPPLTSLYATRSSSPVQERTHKGNSRRNRLFREERRVSFKRDSDEENIRQVQHLLERNDLGRNSELRKQEQEIERLERKLAKYHERPSVSPDERESKPIRHEEVWNSDSEESDMDRRRKATRRRERMSRHEEGRRRRSEAEVPSMRDQRLEREAEQRERLKARFAREREEEWYHGVKTDDERARPVRQEYSRVRDEEESRRRSEAARRLNRLEKMEKEEEEDNRVYRWRFKKMEGEESVSQESEMKDKSDISAASMEMVRRESWQRARDEDRHDSFSLADTSSEHQDILITTPSTENTMMERVEDDIPGKISGELSLPDSLEDLLIQWTTLDRQEIQRG